MNFDFSDDQKGLQDQVNKFLREQCPFTVPRRILETDEAYAADLWQGAAELGLMGTAIPEQYGGVGFGYLELCCIAEELGRAVAPIPFASSIYLAAEAILLAGTDAQKEQYLPKLASGESIGTFAVAEGPKTPTADNLETTLSGGAVTGEKLPVLDGDVADFAIVAARDAGGVSLAIVDLTGDGVDRSSVTTIDATRSQARVTFSGAPADPLGEAGNGWALLQRVFDRAAVLLAFEQVGGASAALAQARQYSLERYAFGRPIGSFQAMKHRMAQMYVKTELAKSNAYFGAWALSTDAPELAAAAAGARVAATQAYDYAAKENIQIHGGIGFTWEYDAQFHYRRARLLGLMIGSELEWKENLIQRLEEAALAAAR